MAENNERSGKDVEKKKYEKPRLKKFGTVREFTRTISHGSTGDASAPPYDRVMMCITPAPSVEEHRFLVSDQICQKSFREAVNQLVKPGDVVLDLGAGSCIHTVFALQAGASKVYAIEVDPVIEMGRQVVADNGWSDKVEFIYGDSLEVELPEKVDCIITNIGFLGTLESLPDARKRFLKPGGRTLPDAIALNFVPLQHEDFYKKTVSFWDGEHFGLDFTAFRKMAANHPMYLTFDESHFMGEFEQADKIDLTRDVENNLYWSVSLNVTRSGRVDGFGGWYDFFLDGESFLSTKPPLQMNANLWSEIFLPLEQPIEVVQGQTLTLEVSMHRKAATDGPLWRWRVISDDEVLVDQSSFDATPVSAGILSKLN